MAIVSAAPISIEVGDRTFRFAPLPGRAWGRLIQWVRETHIQTAARALDSAGTNQNKQIVMDRAYAFAARLSLFVDEDEDLEAHNAFFATLGTFDGMNMVVRESMLKVQRNGEGYQDDTIDEDFVESLMEQAPNPAEIFTKVMDISQKSLANWKQATGGQKKKARGARSNSKTSSGKR